MNVMIKRIVVALLTLAISGSAAAQAGPDPVGRIVPAGKWQGGHDVLIGRAANGDMVCYRREEGDTHRLDIGIGKMGAFVRLESPEPRDMLVSKPVRAYAAVEQVRNDRATGHFTSLLAFEGELSYLAPDYKILSFVLVAPTEPAQLLAVVAAARGNFLVIEQRGSSNRDYVAIYQFDRDAAEAILACQQRQAL